MGKPRRVVVVWIPEDSLMEILGGWNNHLTTENVAALPSLKDAKWADDGTHLPIPGDATLEQMTFAWDRRALGVLLSHPSFPLVKEGERPREAILTEVLIRGLPVRRVNQAWVVQSDDGGVFAR